MSGPEKQDLADLEAEMKASIERELRESQQRMQAAAIAPPPDPEPSPLPPEPKAEEKPAEPEAPPPQQEQQEEEKKPTLAADVAQAFADFRIGEGEYVVELATSQGPSQAVHLRLRPRRPGYGFIVGGTVDAEKKRAELREFEYVRVVHSLRFPTGFDVKAAEWEELLRKAESVLKAVEIDTVRIPPPMDLLRQASSKRISRPMLAAFIIVTVLATLVSWRVLLVLLHSR
jgi:hypothetical protein